MSKKSVVLATFDNESAADSAVQSIKDWDKTNDMVKVNAMGVLVLDEHGDVKTHKMGRRSAGKGAGIGVVLAMLTPVGFAAGVVGGGLLGALHHKGLGITEDDRDRIATELENGKAAVGVLANVDQGPAIAMKMQELGGKPEVHGVTDAALDEAATEMAKAAPEGETPAR